VRAGAARRENTATAIVDAITAAAGKTAAYANATETCGTVVVVVVVVAVAASGIAGLF
jgi:hypothetical protein